MALMLPRSIFFHIEKTGGVWVKEAVRRAGIPAHELTPFGDGPMDEHCLPEHVDIRGKFTFTFVRNPVDLYTSLWAFRMMHGWRNRHPLSVCRSDEFAAFMRQVLDRFPGYVSRLYDRYIGPPPGRLDFVGHQETLADDLVRALTLAGERFDPRKLRATPLANMSFGHRGLYTPALLRAVERAEWRAMVRFGYARASATAPTPARRCGASGRAPSRWTRCRAAARAPSSGPGR